MSLTIRPKDKWDFVSLGEVMLRFDPGDRRISTARRFDVHEGGGEYNVARGLKRCFRMDTAIVTAFADNPVGRLLEDLINQGGVDQSLVRWVNGPGVRNGLNFVERGFGVRAALGYSDRQLTAVSQLKTGEIAWDEIFDKTRWFHTGGIFAALSETTTEVALEAMQAAKRHGVIVSYDLNFRPSLWKGRDARAVNRRLAPLVDVMIGNEEDFSAALGFDQDDFKTMAEKVVKEYALQVVAKTIRNATTATKNDWGAICYAGGAFHEAKQRKDLEIYDRVGGGDSFASGLIYGFLTGQSPQWAIECGAAHGALAMTTPGDTSMATLEEVLQVMKGAEARIAR